MILCWWSVGVFVAFSLARLQGRAFLDLSYSLSSFLSRGALDLGTFLVKHAFVVVERFRPASLSGLYDNEEYAMRCFTVLVCFLFGAYG